MPFRSLPSRALLVYTLALTWVGAPLLASTSGGGGSQFEEEETERCEKAEAYRKEHKDGSHRRMRMRRRRLATGAAEEAMFVSEPGFGSGRRLLSGGGDNEFNTCQRKKRFDAYALEFAEEYLAWRNSTDYTNVMWTCKAKNEEKEDKPSVERFKYLAKRVFEPLRRHWNHYCDTHHGHHLAAGVHYVLFVAFVLLMGCFLKWGSERVHLPVPYTVLLLVLGALLEVWHHFASSMWGTLRHGFEAFGDIDPHMILVLFIPGLIFESAFNTSWHIFFKEKEQSLILAGPGVIMNTLLTGGAMHYFNGYDWSWSFAWMFGSIVSATDPVAVVALLKELGASKRLSTLIESESLLNDGTAFVLFVMLRDYASASGDERNGTATAVVIGFLRLGLGGLVLGIVSGWTLTRLLASVFNDFQVEITLTISVSYIAFYFGDLTLGVSGVLCVVFLGLIASKNRAAISPVVEETMHHFWEMVGFVANTVLFFVTGQVVAFKILNAETISGNFGAHVGYLLLLYLVIHCTRGLAIWQLFPVLEHVGYGCTWKDACIMWYGGLRGAIGLALALLVETEPDFSDRNKDLVLFHVSGVVVLTLIVNASTVGYLVAYLGLNKPPVDTLILFSNTVAQLAEETKHKLGDLKRDHHYRGANWTQVANLQPNYEELLQSIFGEEYQKRVASAMRMTGVAEEGEDAGGTHVINLLDSIRDVERAANEKREVEKRMIQIMKASYWSQFEKGLISADAVNVLVEAAESAMDNHDLSFQMQTLDRYFNIPDYVKSCYRSKYRVLKWFARKMLFDSLGFAIELAAGLMYSTTQAQKQGEQMLQYRSVDPDHIRGVMTQINAVATWISKRSEGVERVYPEVHEAIQTNHAAHALLHAQRHNIEHLKHQGLLDEADFDRFIGQCDKALLKLFHTSYSDLLLGSTDDQNILKECGLFADLTHEEKELVLSGSKLKLLERKNRACVYEAGDLAKSIFIITRGNIQVREITEHENVIRSRSSTWGGPTLRVAPGETIMSLSRGDVFDVYTLLQETRYKHKFVLASEQVHGFELSPDIFLELKDRNVDFWDALWRYAAVELIQLYFKDEPVFAGVDLDNVHGLVFRSRIGFFDSKTDESAQIHVKKGFGLLLNGTVVHISNPHERAEAPTILFAQNQSYIAVDDIVVVIFLNLESLNDDEHKMDRMMSSKAAKLFGNEGQSHRALELAHSGDESESDEEYSSDELQEIDEKTELAAGRGGDGSSQPTTPVVLRAVSAPSTEAMRGDRPAILGPIKSVPEEAETEHHDSDSSEPPVTEVQQSLHPDHAVAVASEAQTSIKKTVSYSLKGQRSMKRQHRRLMSKRGTLIARTNTRRNLIKRGVALELDPTSLPDGVDELSMDTWNVKQAFEVIKHLLVQFNHTNLFNDVELFRIHATKQISTVARISTTELPAPDALRKVMSMVTPASKPDAKANKFAARPSMFLAGPNKSLKDVLRKGQTQVRQTSEEGKTPLFYKSSKFEAKKKRFSQLDMDPLEEAKRQVHVAAQILEGDSEEEEDSLNQLTAGGGPAGGWTITQDSGVEKIKSVGSHSHGHGHEPNGGASGSAPIEEEPSQELSDSED